MPGLLLILWWLAVVYTDLLWFEHMGYRSVYVKILVTKVLLFVGGAALASLVIACSLYLSFRFSRGQSILNLSPDTLRMFQAIIFVGAVLTVLVSGLIFGLVAASRWETFLLFFNRLPFGVADPQFGLDASFYSITLNLLNFVQGWMLGLIIVTIVASVTLYISIFAFRGVSLRLTLGMLRHSAILGLFLMLTLGFSHILDVYELVLSSGGVVYGAGYADVHARIPVLWFLTGIAAVAAVGFGASYRFVGPRLMLGSFSLWVVMMLLGGVLYPALVQRLQVAPNQFIREEPFILRNLQATRAAYQLDQVLTIPYPATETLDAADVQANGATLDNIRLWDLPPLQDAYNQLQFMELYYSFLNVDSDRYRVGGRLRQVLVAARELDMENLPPDAQNWVNQRLQYTHGYGIAMSPATDFTPGEGRPEFFVRDIPIRGQLQVNRPEFYYGESPSDFAMVNTSLREIDPDDAFDRYEGSGGVAVGSVFRQAVFAVRFGDVNILLSDQIGSQSRIQYHRQIRGRVATIAPFLKLDHDPYPVLDQQGKLWWIQDAYTITNRYPYSTPSEGREFNYIRNSVKVLVDAYNGDVYFYVIDAQDPLLQMYRSAFPALFLDILEMSPDVKEHVRYPITLFSAQAEMYLRYHVNDPQVFFNQSDQWALPLETRFGKQGVRVTPSYLVTQLPGGAAEEFVILLPVTPAGDKKNLVGWLAARNDSPNYGQLVSYELPDDRQIDGPSQVEARIENDQRVSQQFTLWDGAGSQIIRGQLLVLPIADTILYVEPLYLQSSGLAFPELKKVILADATNLVMADSIDEGLRLLVGEGIPLKATVRRTEGVAVSPIALEGLDHIEEVIQGVSESLETLEKTLENLRETLGGGTP